MTGGAFVHRARQIKVVLERHEAAIINAAPGVKSVSDDATDIFNSICCSRLLGYWNERTNAPALHRLSGKPLGRKTAAASSDGIVIAMTDGQLVTSHVLGGSSDNAPNARATIREVVPKCMKASNGVNASGATILTEVNGVAASVVFVGSPVHLHHLAQLAIVNSSFGRKTGGIDDVSAGQVAYKFGAVVNSDQRASAHGGASVYTLRIEEFFGRKGRFSLLPPKEHEGRWGMTLAAMRYIAMLIDEPLPSGRGPVGANSFSALCLFMRSVLKAGSWQIGALYMCAVWAMNEEVVFAVRVSVECGRFYEEELNWLRKKSNRQFLSHYPAGDFKMRELPGHLHAVQSKFYKQLVAEPKVALPGLSGLLAQLSGDDSRQKMLARIAAGASAGQKTFAEHASWIYKAQGLPLHINTSGSAGSAARAIVQVASDLCFGEGADELKAAAMASVVEHQYDPEDVLFLRLMKADVIGVQHFLRQYHLVLGAETERIALATEWRDLACHVGGDYFNDPVIHDLFDKKFPVLHRRQQLWVDPYLTDTLHNEAEFSIQRRLHNKSLTTTSMDDRMWWDIEVVAPLREIGRQIGEKQRAASKAARDAATVGPANKPVPIAASDWSRSYLQCNGVCAAIVRNVFPKLTDAAMTAAPSVRKDLKEAAGLVKQDRVLAQTWLDELKENAGGYRREVSLEELKTEAAKVQLAHELKPLITETIPLRPRLDLPFSSVPAPSMEAELRGALPLGLLALKLASSEHFAGASVNPPLRLLLAVLLPSRPSMAAVVKAVAVPSDSTLAGAASSVFDLVRAGRPKALVSDARFIVRFLGIAAAPIMADLDRVTFCALLAQVDEDQLMRLNALLLRRRRVAEATIPAPYFRANGMLLKGNVLTALTAFSESALRVLEYLGGYSEDRFDGETGGLLAGSPKWGPEAGSAGAMFILGCMAMGPAQRRKIGCTTVGGIVSPLPRHGTGGFVSVLQQQERGAAEAALMD